MFNRTPVVGVHDPPGLEVRDYLLDHPADLVDLSVKLLLPVQQLASRGFSEGRDRGPPLLQTVELCQEEPDSEAPPCKRMLCKTFGAFRMNWTWEQGSSPCRWPGNPGSDPANA